MPKKLPVVMIIALFFYALNAYPLDPFEIQVYDSGQNKPGETTAELHSNYTANGTSTSGSEALLATQHLAHNTLELALGLPHEWELGAYLQTATTGNNDNRISYFGGAKIRAKYFFSNDPSQSFYLGVNGELGRVPAEFDESLWGLEIRPILGWKLNQIEIAINPIVSWALSGNPGLVPSFEPAAKLSYNRHWAIRPALEYYLSLGQIDSIPSISNQTHQLFIGGDLESESLEFNFGLGKGLTSANRDLIVKLILGHSI